MEQDKDKDFFDDGTTNSPESASDEMTDQVSARLTGESPTSTEPDAESAETVVLEEEKVKDEIEIQIDL
ncbi:MAG TPA: hypothetical protein VH681_09410, partial [Nitrospiraceae bacterium]